MLSKSIKQKTYQKCNVQERFTSSSGFMMISNKTDGSTYEVHSHLTISSATHAKDGRTICKGPVRTCVGWAIELPTPAGFSEKEASHGKAKQ
jgi:hypothetical protein